MKILIPGEKDLNPYFEEILKFSKFQFDFFENLEDSWKEENTILIQWPETLCNWEKPDEQRLQSIFFKLEEWRRKARIIYLVHNEKSHREETAEWQELYKKVEETAHIMVHLGEFSKTKYQKRYPDKKHIYIPHPLYVSSYKKFSKGEARQILGIDQDAVVLFAGGKIRNLRERKLVLNVFRRISDKNKVLLSSYMYWRRSSLQFRGRERLKRIWDVKKTLEKLYNSFKRPEYIFNYSFTEPDNLALMVSASDVVMVPRFNSLNSGVVFLGLSFNKIVFGPNIGNIKEVLELFNFPIFNPLEEKSISEGINAAIEMTKREWTLDRIKLNLFDPAVVASQWDELLKEVLTN